MKKSTLIAAILVLGGPTASAQEVTLRAVTSFAEKTQFSRNFERFIDKVNADGKGVIQINYIGGPRAMPPGPGSAWRSADALPRRWAAPSPSTAGWVPAPLSLSRCRVPEGAQDQRMFP